MHRLSRCIVLISAQLAVMAPALAAADCEAHVQPMATSLITDRGQLMLNFTVEAQPCNDHCRGTIDVRVHYLDPSGEPMSYDLSLPWAADAGQALRLSKLTYRDSCNDMFGPCELREIEVLNVTCAELLSLAF